MNLVIAAHPDDIEFGMGATLIQLERCVCVISFQCTEMRQKEAIVSLSKLGISSENILFTNAINHRDLISEYDLLFLKFQPTHVFTHFFGDSHQEHKMVYDCVISALRKFPNTNCLLWENNQPGSMTHETFSSRIFIPVQREHMERKINALTEHFSQMKKYNTEQLFEYLWNKSKINGYLCGSLYAEAFFPIKYIIKL